MSVSEQMRTPLFRTCVNLDPVAAARAIAQTVHGLQRDKLGEPYLGHVGRVAARSASSGPSYETAAWLHDVVEDSPVTLEDLRAAGFEARVVDAVDCLTRRPGEAYDAFIWRVRGDWIARRVKLNDLLDNSAPYRLERLDQRTRDRLTLKYAGAVKILNGWMLNP